MNKHAGVREGDERATFVLLRRLARQAARRFPPPRSFGRWTEDAVLDLVSDAFARKGQFHFAAIAATTGDGELERYLLRVFEHVLSDRARETERGKLIVRLKTILGAADRFARHTSPFDSWRVVTAPATPWQGDIDDLISAARELRGVAATRWNTSGPTPRATRDAIVRVSEAALKEAAGLVRDADVAHVVQLCVPAVPIDAADAEQAGFSDVTARAPDEATVDNQGDGTPTPDAVASAVWAVLDDDERRALPHLGQGDRAVAAALGLGRRAGAAVAASVRDKVRTATQPGDEESVVFVLLAWARAAATDPAGTGSAASAAETTDAPTTLDTSETVEGEES